MSTPISSLTRLLQKQKEQPDELTAAVSIEGVEVPFDSPSLVNTNALPIHSNQSSAPQSPTNHRSISITSNAPPIRAPTSASIHRQPSFYSGGSLNNSYNGASSVLSTSIPFAVPNSSQGSMSGSIPKHSGLPSNVSMIESTNITSPQVNHHSEIEPRFVISKQKVQQVQMGQSSKSNLSSGMFGRSRKSQMDLSSFYGYSSPPSNETNSIDVLSHSPSSISSNESSLKSKHSSMADLKRFFKKQTSSTSPKTYGTMSPITSTFSMSSHNPRDRSGSMSSSYANNVSQYTTPQVLPFSKRYSKFGDSLGAGAGGQVKLVKRLSDNVTFAVKEFRPRSSTETRREYAKKITSEYCIGSTLRHQNVIQTVEIAYENDRILQVLEYCDFDLFALVMSNKMSVEEIDCCFKQILSGVQYIHNMGLAHRDLKLDNCVVTSSGIVKIIDFGSAVVFSYPFSNTLIEASGIVGSDPYLSPETLVFTKYDPRPVDIWSVAMIYCCMVLKKFPWKVPKLSDNSFKLFCTGRQSDSLSALLTQKPPPHTLTPEPAKKQTGGLSNLSRAFNVALQDIENSDNEEEEDEALSFGGSQSKATPKLSKEDSNVTEKPYETATPATTKSPASDAVSSESNPGAEAPKAEAASGGGTEEPGAEHTSTLTGPDRLLKALPEHTRALIGKMVVLAPACRAQIDEVMADPWLQSVEMCHVEEHIDASGLGREEVVKSKGHQHTWVEWNEAHIAALEKKKGRR